MKRNFLYFISFIMALIMGCKNDGNITGLDSAQGEWKAVRIADTTSSTSYSKIYFTDGMNGWVIGGSGTILHTGDGGNSWNVQQSETTVSLHSIYFASANKGWVGGGSNSIGTTTNGGATWSWQHPAGESRRTFMSMSFIDEHTGWVVDNYGGILHTKDGGMTWTPQNSNTTWAITSVQFLDNKEGWATATNCIVLHTTDGGNNWMKQTLNSSDATIFNDIFFYNRSKGWIATNNIASSAGISASPIIRTTDTGRNWISQPILPDWIFSLQFVNENSGWAASWSGILHTNDGGITWAYQLKLASGLFEDLYFADQSHGWALSFTGDIYKYQIK